MSKYQSTREYANHCDEQDSLKNYRNHFHLPQHEGKPLIYLCGNSLGLQPKGAAKIISEELEVWSDLAVEGHFKGKRPWMEYHKNFTEGLKRIVGAKSNEVVAMNSVTANLHLMMVSFYRPTEKRYKILCEAGAFPSDQYALESQARFHGFDPDDAIVEMKPGDGAHTINDKDIISKIHELGDSLAMVMFGGVQYYTGQFFDLPTITSEAHKVGAIAGFDLAHAVGNIPLSVHDWGVDFAVWCSYKYLNSGPGAVGGTFVHENNLEKDLPQFAGWWGHKEEERFFMRKGFIPMNDAGRWQLSNAPVLNMASHLASLEIFQQAGMDNLRKKSLELTGFLEFLLNRESSLFDIITPEDPSQRGCQLSIEIKGGGKPTFDRLTQRGVIADWREPNVIRVAPVPLYNTFTEVFDFVDILREELTQLR